MNIYRIYPGLDAFEIEMKKIALIANAGFAIAKAAHIIGLEPDSMIDIIMSYANRKMKSFFKEFQVTEDEIKEGDTVLVVGKYVQKCLSVHADFDGIQIDWNPEIDCATVAKSQCRKLIPIE